MQRQCFWTFFFTFVSIYRMHTTSSNFRNIEEHLCRHTINLDSINELKEDVAYSLDYFIQGAHHSLVIKHLAKKWFRYNLVSIHREAHFMKTQLHQMEKLLGGRVWPLYYFDNIQNPKHHLNQDHAHYYFQFFAMENILSNKNHRHINTSFDIHHAFVAAKTLAEFHAASVFITNHTIPTTALSQASTIEDEYVKEFLEYIESNYDVIHSMYVNLIFLKEWSYKNMMDHDTGFKVILHCDLHDRNIIFKYDDMEKTKAKGATLVSSHFHTILKHNC